jgi:carboxypeptidase Q
MPAAHTRGTRRSRLGAALSAARAPLTLIALIPVLLAPGTTRDREPRAAAAAELAERIVTEGLVRGRAYEHLRDLIQAAPHRLSGSPGAAAAVEWARQRMLEIGFDEVRLEPCMVPHWERGEIASVRLTAPAPVAGDSLACLALGGSVPTPEGGLEAEVLRVESFEELQARRDDAAGRIVYFAAPFATELRSTFDGYGASVGKRSNGPVEAAKAGAIAVVIRSVGSELDDFPHTGATRYQDGVPRIPAAAISTRAAERLDALLERGPARLHLELDCRWLEDAPSFNVVGDYVGREKPEEVVLIGGHLDGWDVGHGAHDDGSGCAHVLEVVRLFRALALRPRRTVRVVLYMNEENGLRGAQAYRDAHADELGSHVMALESDRGGFTPRGFTSNANLAALETLREYAAPLASLGASTVEPGGGGADISVLAAAGVPLVGYLPDSARYFDYHHTHSDTLDKVSPRELNAGAAAIAVLVHAVADAEEALTRNL